MLCNNRDHDDLQLDYVHNDESILHTYTIDMRKGLNIK